MEKQRKRKERIEKLRNSLLLGVKDVPPNKRRKTGGAEAENAPKPKGEDALVVDWEEDENPRTVLQDSDSEDGEKV